MAREKFPRQIVYFECFVPNDMNTVVLGNERVAYGGIIEPTGTPCTQAQYDKIVKRTIAHYKKLEKVIRIEVTYFYQPPVGHQSKPVVLFERKSRR